MQLMRVLLDACTVHMYVHIFTFKFMHIKINKYMYVKYPKI